MPCILEAAFQRSSKNRCRPVGHFKDCARMVQPNSLDVFKRRETPGQLAMLEQGACRNIGDLGQGGNIERLIPN
jgi:hypothetical protein